MPKFRKPNPKLEDKRVITNQAREIRILEDLLRKAIAERDSRQPCRP